MPEKLLTQDWTLRKWRLDPDIRFKHASKDGMTSVFEKLTEKIKTIQPLVHSTDSSYSKKLQQYLSMWFSKVFLN